MKKVLAFAIGTTLATVAMPSFAVEQHLDNVAVYVAATYTKPSNNGLSIGDTQIFSPAPLLYPYSHSLFLSPDYNWDYWIGVSYHVPCTNTRLFAEYDYYSADHHREAKGAANILPGIVSGGQNGSSFTRLNNISATVLQNSHEWRFGFRRFVQLGTCFSTELRAFMEYDKVTQDMHNWVRNNDPENNAVLYQEFNSNFRGWGPGLGLHFRGVPFAFCNYLGLFAKLDTTLFYAKNLYNISILASAFSGGNDSSDVFFAWTPENTKSIIGKFDIHVGLDYLRVFHVDNCPVNFGLTLGLRYMNIVNAFKGGNTAAESFVLNPDLAGRVSNLTAFGIPRDWGRVGPYLQFTLGGANA